MTVTLLEKENKSEKINRQEVEDVESDNIIIFDPNGVNTLSRNDLFKIYKSLVLVYPAETENVFRKLLDQITGKQLS